MAIEVSASGGNFTPPPEGQFAATCCDVVDLGFEPNPFKPGSDRRRVQISWLLSETMEDGRPFLISRKFTASLHNEATLRKILEAWRGKAFSTAELKSFDLETLIGAPALIQVTHEEKGEKVYANASSIMKLPKAMAKEAPSIEGYVRKRDRDDQGGGPTKVGGGVITKAQHDKLKAAQREVDMPDEQYYTILKMYGYKTGVDIKPSDYDAVLQDVHEWLG